MPGRHEENLVEGESDAGLLGKNQMAVMGWIERPPQDARHMPPTLESPSSAFSRRSPVTPHSEMALL